MRARTAAAAPLLAALCLIAGATAAQAADSAVPVEVTAATVQAPEEPDDDDDDDVEDRTPGGDDTGAPVPTPSVTETQTSSPTPTPTETEEPEGTPTPQPTTAPPAESDDEPETGTPDDGGDPAEPEDFALSCYNASLDAGTSTSVTVTAPQGTTLSLGSTASTMGAQVSIQGSQVVFSAPASASGQDTFTVTGSGPDGQSATCQVTFTVYTPSGSPTPPEETPSPTDPASPTSPGTSAPGTPGSTPTTGLGGGAPTPTSDGVESIPASPPADLSIPGSAGESEAGAESSASGGYGLTMPGISGLMNPSNGNPHVSGGEDRSSESSDEEAAEDEDPLAQTGTNLWASLLALLAIALGSVAVIVSRRRAAA